MPSRQASRSQPPPPAGAGVYQGTVIPLHSIFGPLMLATSHPSALTCPVMLAVRPCPPTSFAVIEKVRVGVTDPVAWAIAFMSSQASIPLSELLGPTVTCQSSAGHGPDAWEWNAKTLPGGTADWADCRTACGGDRKHAGSDHLRRDHGVSPFSSVVSRLLRHYWISRTLFPARSIILHMPLCSAIPFRQVNPALVQFSHTSLQPSSEAGLAPRTIAYGDADGRPALNETSALPHRHGRRSMPRRRPGAGHPRLCDRRAKEDVDGGASPP